MLIKTMFKLIFIWITLILPLISQKIRVFNEPGLLVIPDNNILDSLNKKIKIIKVKAKANLNDKIKILNQIKNYRHFKITKIKIKNSVNNAKKIVNITKNILNILINPKINVINYLKEHKMARNFIINYKKLNRSNQIKQIIHQIDLKIDRLNFKYTQIKNLSKNLNKNLKRTGSKNSNNELFRRNLKKNLKKSKSILKQIITKIEKLKIIKSKIKKEIKKK